MKKRIISKPSMRTTLVSAFAFIAFCIVLVGAVGVNCVSDGNHNLRALSEDMKLLNLLDELRFHIRLQRFYEKDFLVNIGNEKKMKEYRRLHDSNNTAISGKLRELESLSESHSEISNLRGEAKDLRKRYETYVSEFRKMVDSVFADGSKTALDGNRMMNTGKETIHKAEASIEKLRSDALIMAREVEREGVEAGYVMAYEMSGIAILALALSVTTAILSVRKIGGLMREVVDFASSLAKGTLDRRLPMGTPVNCGAIKKCGKKDCPSFGKASHCWTESGSFATDPSCPKAVKGADCRECDLYKKNVKTELAEMGAALNGMADGVRLRALIADDIARGELSSHRHDVRNNDSLGLALREMTRKLSETIDVIQMESQALLNDSRQIAEVSQAIACGASEQAAAIEEIGSSSRQMDAQSRGNAEKAKKAGAVSERMKGKVENGAKLIDDLTSASRDIKSSAEEILKIIKMVDDISFQTNVLALNAAVESARAGRHGKGFAVVAEEVRSLAIKSASASSEIVDLIDNSLSGINGMVACVEKTAGAFRSIAEDVGEAGGLVGEIARASEEQSLGFGQVVSGIGEIDKVVQMNAARSEEAAATAKDLAVRTSRMTQICSFFKIDGNGKVTNSTQRKLETRMPITFEGNEDE